MPCVPIADKNSLTLETVTSFRAGAYWGSMLSTYSVKRNSPVRIRLPACSKLKAHIGETGYVTSSTFIHENEAEDKTLSTLGKFPHGHIRSGNFL